MKMNFINFPEIKKMMMGRQHAMKIELLVQEIIL